MPPVGFGSVGLCLLAPPTIPLDLAPDGHVAGPETSSELSNAEPAGLVLSFNEGPIHGLPGGGRAARLLKD
jgi:hypothetical protein